MVVHVRLFAMLRERAGTDALELELPEGARVADALDQVGELADGLPLVMAVNRVYADADARLSPGDELALIPPVSGGAEQPVDGERPGGVERASAARTHAAVTDAPLSLDALVAFVRDPRAGAIVTFQGVTREVEALEYEAYAEMAREQLAAIVAAAAARHALCAAAVEHRVGAVALSEPSVAVAVSAAHRGEAFAAAREVIDEVKARAPIWKREIEGDRGSWVRGTRPTTG